MKFNEGPAQSYLIVVLGIVALFFSYDLTIDIQKGDESLLHLWLEGLVFMVATAALVMEFRRTFRLRRSLDAEKIITAKLSGELFTLMEEQFRKWQLSEAEKEVSLLLIKGCSMQEIAALRGVKEKTARQQAASVYAKSECAGRHELASWFVQDLLQHRS